MFKDGYQQIASSIETFFFRREVPYSLALLRIVLPLTLLTAVLPRWPYIRELYSLDGSPAPLWETYAGEFSLPIFSAPIAVALYTALVFCLIAASLGWMTRVSLIAATFLYPYFFVLDVLGTTTKYAVIATHLLLILSVSQCGSVWSLDAFRQRKDKSVQAEVWPQRLIQLLICAIYFGAAIAKFNTPAFMNTDQMTYWMLTNVNFPNPLGEWLSQYTPLVFAMGLVTILWEVTFSFLCWNGFSRKVVLSIGVVFHAMTFFLLGLLVFPLIMLPCYLAFLTEHEAGAIGRKLSSMFNRFRAAESDVEAGMIHSAGSWMGLSSFAMVLALFMAIGVTAEARMDVYGEHRAEGRYQLRPLSVDEIEKMTRQDTAISLRDQVFNVTMGTKMVHGLLADSRTEYRVGEKAAVQIRFIQPHGDLWTEVMLSDQDGNILARDWQVARREVSSVAFQLPISEEYPPGAYQFHIRLDGQSVYHRDFQILK